MHEHPPDPFDILGLPPRFDLNPADLQRAYLERSAAAHPDRAGDAAADLAARINHARHTLADPERRADALLARLARLARTTSAPPALPGTADAGAHATPGAPDHTGRTTAAPTTPGAPDHTGRTAAAPTMPGNATTDQAGPGGAAARTRADAGVLPDGFLAEMLEIREEIESATAASDHGALRRWEQWAEDRRAAHIRTVADLFARLLTPLPTAAGTSAGATSRTYDATGAHASPLEPGTLRAIRAELNAWRYIERLLEQLDPA